MGGNIDVKKRMLCLQTTNVYSHTDDLRIANNRTHFYVESKLSNLLVTRSRISVHIYLFIFYINKYFFLSF